MTTPTEPTQELLPITQQILIVLGFYRDDMSAEAVQAFQNLASDLTYQPQPVAVERLKTLIAKRRAFVAAREAMNAARPTDTLTATRAQYVLYDERYQADNEACRELHREAARFAEWAANNEEAAISAMQGAGGEEVPPATCRTMSAEEVREACAMIVDHAPDGDMADISAAIRAMPVAK